MGVFSRAAQKAAAIGYPAPGWAPPYGYAGDSIATTVNQNTAMGVLAFTSGIRLIAEDLAHLPLITYERLDKGKRRAREHPAYAMLHDAPNPEMTSMVFRETGIAHMYSWGDWFAEKELNGLGVPVRLWPLRPDKMTVEIDRDTGLRIYKYRLPDGTGIVLPANRVFHVPGWGFDGLRGYSRVTLMRRALEGSIVASEYGLRTLANDARPGVTILHPNQLEEIAKQNIVDSWDENHKGLSNAQRTAVLDEGMTIEHTGFSPEDAQYLDSRKFSTIEVAQGLRLPPHKLADLENAHFTNIEESNIEYVTALLPPATRIEQQINKDIIGGSDPAPGGHFVEHLFEKLLRGKTLERAQAQEIRIRSGTLSPDEARDMENQNPIPDGSGEVFLAPLNMTPLDMLAQAVAARAAAPPEPNPAEPLMAALAAYMLKDQSPVSIAEGAIHVTTPPVTFGKGAVQVDNHIHPATVNVAPAAVNVTVPEPAKTRKVLTRDEKGRITGLTEVPDGE